jgi:hypothetical protein
VKPATHRNHFTEEAAMLRHRRLITLIAIALAAAVLVALGLSSLRIGQPAPASTPGSAPAQTVQALPLPA